MQLRSLIVGLAAGLIIGWIAFGPPGPDRATPGVPPPHDRTLAHETEPDAPTLHAAGRAGAERSAPAAPDPEASASPAKRAPPKMVTMRTADVPEPPPDAVSVEELLPPELKKAAQIDAEHEIFGDRTKYGFRVQLHDSRGYAFARSGLQRQPGRTVPDAWVPFVLKVAGIDATKEEQAQYIARGWELWREESRLLGELAKRTQDVIDRMEAAGEGEQGLAALEVRKGKVYVVRSEEDLEIRSLMESLRGLDEQRQGFARRIASDR